MKVNDACTYRALNRISHEACDFCDKVFDNRYDSIIHNASHIIIPLLKGSISSCKICNTYYTSTEELESHNSLKHCVNRNEKIKVEIKEEIDITDNIENGKNNELNDKKILKSPAEPIRNRLKFEDDCSISNGLIRDLVTECKVNVQIFDPPWLYPNFRRLNKENVIKSDETRTDISICNRNGIITDDKFESISYSCLIKPGIYNCKYCTKSYPNRFTLIKHEKHHINISKGRPLLCTHCDRYIAGNHYNLDAHIGRCHPGAQNKRTITHKCNRCNLRFKRYKRHVRNYHIHDCPLCGMEFTTHNELQDHEKICTLPSENAKLIKVCSLCYSFFKSKINLNYHYMGVMGNEVGVRYSCEYCGKKYFELNLVKRISKKFGCTGKHKRITNEERLKNIQQRLKKLNLLNRFYCVVLFI